MGNIKLFADSTCDLPKAEIEKMDIDIIPLLVTFEEDSFRDGSEITAGDLFKLVEQRKMLPKTSAPSPVDFYNAFKPYVDDGKSIVYIGLSSVISSTIQNAKLAAEHFEEGKVHVIDSLNLCVGIGALIINAYNYINMGMEVQDVVNRVTELVPNYKLYFTVDTLDYLHMGGRCSSTQALFGNMLNIKPVISMSADGLDVWKKTRGKKKAINLMAEEVTADKDRILNGEIHIGCAFGNEKERDILKNMIIESTGITKFKEYILGCVISSHCGESTVGLGYFLNN